MFKQFYMASHVPQTQHADTRKHNKDVFSHSQSHHFSHFLNFSPSHSQILFDCRHSNRDSDRFSLSMMQNIPKDVVTYDLVPFLVPTTAGRLAATNALYFRALRHRIHRSDLISAWRFMAQSELHSRIIGLSSSVIVNSRNELHVLFQHNSSHSNHLLRPIVYLEIEGNYTIQNVIFPESIVSIKFCDDFNQSLLQVTFPSRLESLEVGKHFSPLFLDERTLPQSLGVLITSYGYGSGLSDDFLDYIDRLNGLL